MADEEGALMRSFNALSSLVVVVSVVSDETQKLRISAQPPSSIQCLVEHPALVCPRWRIVTMTMTLTATETTKIIDKEWLDSLTKYYVLMA